MSSVWHSDTEEPVAKAHNPGYRGSGKVGVEWNVCKCGQSVFVRDTVEGQSASRTVQIHPNALLERDEHDGGRIFVLVLLCQGWETVIRADEPPGLLIGSNSESLLSPFLLIPLYETET